MFIACCLLILLIQCTVENQGDETPKIELVGLSKSSLMQGDLNQDSLWLEFRFEDGDGDFGFGSTDARSEVFVYDERTQNLYDRFKIPDLPPSNGALQKGNIQILLFTTCCLFPNGIPPCSNPPQYPVDSLQFKLNILDRAGNMSNFILTEKLVLQCK